MRRFALLLLTFTLSLIGCRSTGAEMRPRIIEPAAAGEGPEVAGRARAEALGAPAGGRLPRDVVPRAYSLAMTLDPRRDAFEGEVEVAVRLEQARDVIWMHGLDLEILEARVEREGGGSVEARWEAVADDGLAALRLAESVEPGEARIILRYRARLGDGLHGLYRVEVGDDRYLFTQFQSIFARRAFPCFDDPGFKARFRLRLTVPEADLAFSNTPLESESDAGEGWKTLVFAPSPPMPTYLVALAIGPLDVVEAAPIPANDIRREPLPLRGIATRGHGPELARALVETGPILAELERYFGTPHPYAKLDIVAVPDFGAGAMENAGLVTFRESFLLIGDAAPERQRRGFASVMAHELSHMWFGNLVTMRWWDDLWLNEGFATWRASETVARLYPEHRAELAARRTALHAMRADSLIGARRIRQPIEGVDDIENAFDAITYSKGAAVIGMFEAWLGRDAFREGVRRYLAAHRWGNATTDDFLSALSGAARRDVRGPMQSFLDQPGLPFVETTLDCSGRRARLSYRQSRYLPVGSAGDAASSWQLPLCVRYSALGRDARFCALLTEPEGSVDLPTRQCPDWYFPNADGLGYYRFGWGRGGYGEYGRPVISALNEREQLLFADSLRAGFENASVPAAEFYRTFPELSASSARPIATLPMSSLRQAADELVGAELAPRVRAYGASLYRPTFDRLGWEARADEEGEDRLLRASVVRFMADFAEVPAVRAEAVQRARRHLGLGGEAEPGALEPELVGMALAVAVQDSDAAFFDALLARFVATRDPIFRARSLRALSSAREPALAARARALVLDPRLRRAEALFPLWVQLSTPATREAAWSWLEENVDALAARLHDRSGDLPVLGRFFCDEAGVSRVNSLFEPRIDSLPGGRRELRLTVESIRLCGALAAAQGGGARAFFRDVGGVPER